MRFPTLAAAVGLLSTAAEAAPRHRHVDEVEARYIKMGRAVGQDDAAVGVMPRSHNSTRIGSSNQTMSVPEGCPTGSVFVSTTTVDITIYVTPMANSTGSPKAASTEPCDEETTTTPAPSVEPCTDDVGSMTLVTPMTRGPFANSSVTTPRPTPEEPCETGLYVNSTAIYSPTKPPKIPMPTAPFSNRTAVTEPCDETTTGHVPSIATGSASSHSTSLVTTMPPRASTTCVIDTSMTPVAKSTLSSTPAATVTPTKTVCEHDGETGTPSPDSAYCGIRGRPAGAYFIAEFVEDRPGVPVTEEGCYQFCNSVMEDAKGCRSYRYWPGHLGAPRCALYGMPVSYAVKDVDSSQPSKWYDLECGSPDAQPWLQQMSQHRQGKAGP